MYALQIIITGPALKYDFEIENMTFTPENNTLRELKLNIIFLCALYAEEVIN